MTTGNNGSSQKVPRTPVTGRTPSDAVVELVSLAVKVFGIATPFVVVVVAAAYGFYLLQQVYKETDQTRQAVMTDALKETRDSYQSVAVLIGKQIENFNETLDIQDRLGKSLEDLEKEQRERMEKLLSLQKELETARAEIAAEIERQRRTEAELITAQEDLKKKAADAQRRADDLSKRVGTIIELRAALEELAEAVTQELPETSRSNQLAENAISQYVIDPVEILSRFARNPNDKSASASLDKLIGLSGARLRQLLQEFDGFNFSFWLMVEDFEHEETGYIGVAKLTSDSYHGLVYLFEKHDTVFQVEVADEAFGTKLFNHYDWSREVIQLVLVQNGELSIVDASIDRPAATTWRLQDSMFLDTDRSLTDLYHVDGGVQFLTPEGFQSKIREYRDGREILSNVYEVPGLNLAMYVRAERFEQQVLTQANLDLLPDSLKHAFREFVTSAVAREREAGEILVAPHLAPDIKGRVAAATLRPDFRIRAVEPIKIGVAQQQAAPVTDEEPTGYVVLAEYRESEAPEHFEDVTFRFTKREGARGWLLVDFRFGW